MKRKNTNGNGAFENRLTPKQKSLFEEHEKDWEELKKLPGAWVGLVAPAGGVESWLCICSAPLLLIQ